jgi:tRNA G18 (ribose-2'-O)-methylase SpoU
VDWQYFEKTTDAIEFLRLSGYQVLAVEQTTGSISLNEIKLSIPAAIIFGHEIHGVSPDVLSLCQAAIEIPQYGTKHSLNVAVSVGIVLWELITG